MAEDQDRHSKTEEPTARRLEKAREDGQVARSTELTSSVVILCGVFIGMQRAPATVDGLRRVMTEALTGISARDLTPGQILDTARDTGTALLEVAGPLSAAVALAALVATVSQVGIGFYPKKIAPGFEKLDPVKGMQKIFSRKGIAELVKSVLKICLASWVAWKVVMAVQTSLPMLGLQGPREILGAAGADLAFMILWVGGALGVLSIFDYLWQRHEQHQELKMTKQEVKDETKQAEGDPKIRQKFRKAQQEISRNRMISEVETADVVVTNPIHFAVALKYAPDEMGAPTVIAKGAGDLAQRIKEAARKAGVPILERRSLARSLFRTVEVGQEIPAALYRAVAEILAYIYGLRAQRAGVTNG